MEDRPQQKAFNPELRTLNSEHWGLRPLIPIQSGGIVRSSP